jgi:hypothetical protein
MIRLFYVIWVLVGWTLALCAYYVFSKFKVQEFRLHQDEESLQSLKREIEEKGCRDEVIDFWVGQANQNRENARRELEERAARRDTLFFIIWIISLVLVLILVSD